MPSNTGFIISLTQHRLSVIHARRGRVLQAESISLDPQLWSEHWQGGLMRLDPPMRQLLSRFSSGRNGQATLLYQSPTLTKQIYPFDMGGAHARDAARSKLREAVGFSDPVSVCPLGEENASGQSSTMLAFSDREETLRSLYAWLNRCGVRVSSMIPNAIASIVCAADQAMQMNDGSVLFYFDTDISIIAHAEQGKLRLIRPADIGYQKLAESYQQVFGEKKSNPDQETDPHEVMTVANDCLFRYGIPFQPTDFFGIELRSEVLPCMAPVLQRIGIDVKQTIRFGIEGGSNLKKLYVSGPGAAIPSISKAVGEHLELHVQPVAGTEHYEPRKVGGLGTTEMHLIESSGMVQGLLPSVAHDEKLRKRLGRALLTGSAVALLAMGAEYTSATLQKAHVEHQMLREASRLNQVNTFDSDRSEVHQFASMISDISRLVTSKTKRVAHWDDLLSQIGEYTGQGVRVQELRADQSDDTPYMLINGYTVTENDLSPGQVLDQFVEKLKNVKCVESIKLGATSRIELATSTQPTPEQQHWGLQFTLRVMLVTTPSPYESYAVTNSKDADWIVP